MLFLLLLFSSFFFSYSVSKAFPFFNDLLKKTVFTILIGLVAATWLTLPLSWLFGQLSAFSIIASSLLLLAAGVFFSKKFREAKPAAVDSGIVLLAFFFLLFFAALNFLVVLKPNEAGGLDSVISVWGDYPFHSSIITSFVERSNFPPTYPVLINAPLGYPFAFDFLSAALVEGGLDLRSSLVLPNILVGFCLSMLVFLLAFSLTKNKLASAAAVFLLLLNGNAGILDAAQGFLDGNQVFPPTLDYSHQPRKELFFMNLVYSVFIPARGVLFAYTISLLVLLLLYKNLFIKKDDRELLLSGILFGLLPLTAAHVFLTTCLIAGALFLHSFVKKGFKKSAGFASLFLVPAFVLALPQVLWILQQANPSFISFHVGWLKSNAGKGLLELMVFWLRNAWIPLLLAIPGFLLLRREQKIFLAPFFALFFLGNLVKFQPWDWDNTKIFLPWFFATAVCAAVFLHRIFSNKNLLFKTAAVVLFVASIASGILSISWMAFGENARYETFSAQDIALAGWTKRNTVGEAVFLTSGRHNNPISSLAGRQVVMGFEGWLWSHGLDYATVGRDVQEMLSTGDCSLLQKHGVDFVFLGGREQEFEKVFVQKNFPLVYDNGSHKVFKVLCSKNS